MLRRWSIYSLLVGMSLFCVLTLSGCDILDSLAKFFRLDKDASAQNGARRIETWEIRPNTFSIDADTTELETNVDVRGEATIYKGMTGSYRFEGSDGTLQTGNLTTSDVIIERPLAGTVTIIVPD
jgi:hypothetical protein